MFISFHNIRLLRNQTNLTVFLQFFLKDKKAIIIIINVMIIKNCYKIEKNLLRFK